AVAGSADCRSGVAARRTRVGGCQIADQERDGVCHRGLVPGVACEDVEMIGWVVAHLGAGTERGLRRGLRWGAAVEVGDLYEQRTPYVPRGGHRRARGKLDADIRGDFVAPTRPRDGEVV